MRRFLPVLALFAGLTLHASAQSCTGLCQQQVSCTAGTSSTITGTVYAPNGTDPLPNVTVYVPNATVDPFAAGVSCPLPGAVPSGSPLVGTTTATDGTFTLTNVPIGTNIPIVILSGRWRRQITVDTSAGSCANTAAPAALTRFPRNSSEGDIPKFAIVTGNADPVECVLLKVMGGDSTEFTNPADNGRFNFFTGVGSSANQAGSTISSSTSTTPSARTLMDSSSTLNGYDVLMLPCLGSDNSTLREADTTGLGDLTSFANAGGRIYASHYSYDWLDEPQTYANGVVNWNPNQTQPSIQTQNAVVDQTFADGATLAAWLTLPNVGASTTLGQMPISTLRHDLNSVISPTQSWLTLNNDPKAGNAVMQFTFNTPVGQTTGQCGRVLFNEYHVENQVGNSNGKLFPALCGTSTTMTPQEKLLEYMLFNLTSNGGDPTLTPTTLDFGSEPLAFTTATQYFTWKNNSIFSSSVTVLTASGDFAVAGNNCSAVAAGATCQIGVTFTPTVLGARTGTLTVGGGGKTLTAALTGTGVPALSVSTSSLNFGSLDVGASATQTFTLTNSASAAIPVPTVTISGDYTTSNNCGASLNPGISCTISVTFKPSTTGTRTGTLGFTSSYTATVVALTGNGVDFAVALAPTSGQVISGRNVTSTLSASAIAGYASAVALTCTSTTPGSACTLASNSVTPGSGAMVGVTITTTSQYTVVGYSSLGGTGLLALLGAVTVWAMRSRRRAFNALARTGLAVFLLGLASVALTGCGNLAPAKNAVYTAPGSYTYTVTASDGILTHSATYTLNVTAQ